MDISGGAPSHGRSRHMTASKDRLDETHLINLELNLALVADPRYMPALVPSLRGLPLASGVQSDVPKQPRSISPSCSAHRPTSAPSLVIVSPKSWVPWATRARILMDCVVCAFQLSPLIRGWVMGCHCHYF